MGSRLKSSKNRKKKFQFSIVLLNYDSLLVLHKFLDFFRQFSNISEIWSFLGVYFPFFQKSGPVRDEGQVGRGRPENGKIPGHSGPRAGSGPYPN